MITINQGQVGRFTVFTADANGNPAPATGGTATIDNYDAAYVVSTGVANQFMVVSKSTLSPGQKISLTVTFSGSIAADGTTVADLAVSLELDGAPQPPATQFILGPADTPNISDVTVPPDPGSASIPVA